MSNIHSTAIISPKAIIGKNVTIGANTIIYDHVSIADNTVIGAFCELGVQNHLSGGEILHIGANSNIRSHSIFYEGSTFADGLVTGHRVTVREKVFELYLIYKGIVKLVTMFDSIVMFILVKKAKLVILSGFSHMLF